MLKHNDQFQGVSHSYLDNIGYAGSQFNYINPGFYRLVPWEGDGYPTSKEEHSVGRNELCSYFISTGLHPVANLFLQFFSSKNGEIGFARPNCDLSH